MAMGFETMRGYVHHFQAHSSSQNRRTSEDVSEKSEEQKGSKREGEGNSPLNTPVLCRPLRSGRYDFAPARSSIVREGTTGRSGETLRT